MKMKGNNVLIICEEEILAVLTKHYKSVFYPEKVKVIGFKMNRQNTWMHVFIEEKKDINEKENP